MPRYGTDFIRGRSSSMTLAASNSLNANSADYVADSTDATDEIVSALSLSDRVNFLAGTYPVSAIISIAANKTLTGEGRSNTLFSATASWAGMVNPFYITGNYVTLRDLSIDCNSANQTQETVGIVDSGTGITGVIIERVRIVNCYAGGWPRATSLAGSHLLLADCLIEECYYGLMIGYSARYPKVLRNRVTLRAGSSGNALHCRLSEGALFDGNYFNGNKTLGEACDIHNFKNLIFVNNEVLLAGDAGLGIVTIDEGWVAGVGVGFVVSNNHIYWNGGSGMWVGRGAGATQYIRDGIISNNDVFENQESQDTNFAGISFRSGVERVLVTNNRVWDNHAGITSLLTANGLTGATSITVANGSLFHVNMWVIIDDNDSPTQQLNITAINGNVLTVTALTADYTVAQAALIYGSTTQVWGIRETGTNVDYNVYKDNSLLGVASGITPIETIGTRNVYDEEISSTDLDLSAAGTDVEVFHATQPCWLCGYSILYTEASSIDAGVAIRVGRYQSGVALDDDYYDISTSEVSRNLGYAASFVSANLTQRAIAFGDTVTVGTAGGKVGTGEVRVILKIAKMAN